MLQKLQCLLLRPSVFSGPCLTVPCHAVPAGPLDASQVAEKAAARRAAEAAKQAEHEAAAAKQQALTAAIAAAKQQRKKQQQQALTQAQQEVR